MSISLAHETVERMQSFNRRSLDPMAAKVWSATGRAYELGGDLSELRPYVYTWSYISILINVFPLVFYSMPSGQRRCAMTLRHWPLLLICFFVHTFSRPPTRLHQLFSPK